MIFRKVLYHIDTGESPGCNGVVMETLLNSVLIIVNPTAQNGRAKSASVLAERLIRERLGKSSVEVCETEATRHAVDIAREAQGFDLVVALGGDGLIHEVVNGLMQRDASDRPVLGIIPVGSGNDYAASLGVSTKVEKAVMQLFESRVCTVDLGCCNGEYYTETVSFGLDAAIAIDTMERRKKTGRTGTMLYFAAGVEQMTRHLNLHPYRMTFDSGRQVNGGSYILAVQNGQTYGGGFKVCPQARIDDGMLDICVAHPPLNPASALALFVLAKEGKHKNSKQIEFFKTKSVRVELDESVPAQIDGEILEGSVFEITAVPRALRVVAPSFHSLANEAGEDYVRIPE